MSTDGSVSDEEFLPGGLQSDASNDDDEEEENEEDELEENEVNKEKEDKPDLIDPTPQAGNSESKADYLTSLVSIPDDAEENNEIKPKVKRKRKKKKDPSSSDKTNKDKNGEPKKKKKRANKPASQRRNIRKLLKADALDEETVAAQKEEAERKQRLEEQKARGFLSLPQPPAAAAAAATETTTPAVTSSSKTQPEELIILDDSSEDENKEKPSISKKPAPEVIEILSSDDDEPVTVLSDDNAEDTTTLVAGIHTNDQFNVRDAHGRILVNVGHPPNEPDIFVPTQIAKIMKTHQIGGIRFLYDNLVESIERHGTSTGFGCILAHSMGLGKTLQCISFISVFLTHTCAKSVLCIVPINTLQNWVAEFDLWLPKKDNNMASSSSTGDNTSDEDQSANSHIVYRQFPIYVLNDTHKTTQSRGKLIEKWHETGGVLLMGYEMYRLLSFRRGDPNGIRKKQRKKTTTKKGPMIIDLEEEDKITNILSKVYMALSNPGPDLVICDEGHRIKNSHASTSQTLKNIRTRRRVVLTGYPLQNNLLEYWCMVDFVRPNFLGTKHEFSNLFERPILNGQCSDSTPKDVKLMRYRAHVLHSLLEGFVQRRGFQVLTSTLPSKEEHVIFVRLTPFQQGLYHKFMQYFTEMGAGGWCTSNPIKAFSVLCKIWNHPDILHDVLLQKTDSMADLDIPDINTKAKKSAKKNSVAGKDVASCSKIDSNTDDVSYVDKVNHIISFEWARDIMKNYQPLKLSYGSKMILLMKIVEDSIKLGDKLLVFSQSLGTLSLIEKFLGQRTIPKPPNATDDMPTKWQRNHSYFRLDGSTPPSERERLIGQFNKPNNNQQWLFLLSTRAGSLGINLIGANRVVVFDASWNPCHDAQAVCRVYRYGQTKKCHVYRFVTDKTLEKKIYDRQISKQGISDRVVDELNPKLCLTKKEVESLMDYDESDEPFEDFSHLKHQYSDNILKDICEEHSNILSKAPHCTDSLHEDISNNSLTKAEKRQAKKSYEEEKMLNISYSRPSYAAFYPKGAPHPLPNNMAGPWNNSVFNKYPSHTLARPVANVRPMQSTPIPMVPLHKQMPSSQDKMESLKQAGVSVQRIVCTTDIVLPNTTTLTTSQPQVIRAGENVTFIKTQKGMYLRTNDGRILAIRDNTEVPQSAIASGTQLVDLSDPVTGQSQVTGQRWKPIMTAAPIGSTLGNSNPVVTQSTTKPSTCLLPSAQVVPLTANCSNNSANRFNIDKQTSGVVPQTSGVSANSWVESSQTSASSSSSAGQSSWWQPYSGGGVSMPTSVFSQPNHSFSNSTNILSNAMHIHRQPNSNASSSLSRLSQGDNTFVSPSQIDTSVGLAGLLSTTEGTNEPKDTNSDLQDLSSFTHKNFFQN
ncbi:helicase ARIP4-like [Antedon mediterranea]|uniref:helicase ARIP4-like n=1 Tax=Antedon mediterranea TaxID=105859 RepID=UPI003AF5FA04